MKNLLYLLLIISFAASAADFNVDTVQDFRQALIDASNNSEPDTIHVAPGHYDISGGTLLYAPGSGGDFGDDNSGLTIQGEDASSTVLDGKDLVTTLTIRLIATEFTGAIEINGLTFKNGQGENGGGLSITKGIDNQSGYITIKNSDFFQNMAEQNGGGIYMELSYSDSAILMDNRFVENKAGGDGGGFYSSDEGRSEVTDNEFSLNQAGGSGGGVYSSTDLGYIILMDN
jgi:predicted outer membrane repeat protein